MTVPMPHILNRLSPTISRYQLSSVAFWTQEPHLAASNNRSRIGGKPLTPAGFRWPACTRRSLDFLLQLELSVLAPLALPGALPSAGLLTFFYDLDNQPWGYDPKELDGSRVVLITDSDVSPTAGPDSEFVLPMRALDFGHAKTLPSFGSRAYDRLKEEAALSHAEEDTYFEYLEKFERQFYPVPSGLHRLFGHSSNIQGDMQLEAQLVTNGLYCGDPSGYHDPRAAELERGADDWILLLQLDSDDAAGLMWGDLGMLYFWIRRVDLEHRRFERVWMTLQCS